MKNKHSVLIALLMCLVFCMLVFSSCGKNDGTPEDTTTPHTHSYGEWTIIKRPTCADEGEEERTCSCGEKEKRAIAATGLHVGEWKVDKQPTDIENGLRSRTCLTCGENITQELVATKDLNYVLSADGQSYSVSGKSYDTKAYDVVIPKTYKGLPVTRIAYDAFYECHNITDVFIPDSVVSIGDYAFSGCLRLKSITIPANVTIIGKDVLGYCSSLEYISVAKENTVYHSNGNCLIETAKKELVAGCKNSVIPSDGSVTSIGNYAFNGCASIMTITIPSTITSIGSNSFSDCHKLAEVINHSSLSITPGDTDNGSVAYYAKEVHSGESKIVEKDGYLFYTFGRVNYLLAYNGTDTKLVLPENYNNEKYEIYPYALSLNSRITKVTVSAGVSSIGEGAFAYCSELKEITMSDSVTTIDYGAFYNCTSLSGIVWSQELRRIGDAAFYGCSAITDINLPDTVITIGEEAFKNCSGLKTISIPAGMISIDKKAFEGCASLESVSFEGTVEKWNNVSKRDNWQSDAPFTVVHCSDGDAHI